MIKSADIPGEIANPSSKVFHGAPSDWSLMSEREKEIWIASFLDSLGINK